jgi:hypothetical protein
MGVFRNAVKRKFGFIYTDLEVNTTFVTDLNARPFIAYSNLYL